MMWTAKPATTHCRRLCPARIIALPLGHWPATQVFPGGDLRNSSWMACILLCPQNLNNLRIIYNSLFILGPEWSLFVHVRNISSWCAQIIHHLKAHNDCWKKHSHQTRSYLYRIWNINTGSENIWLSWLFQEFIHIRLFCFQILFIDLCVTDPAAERIRVTDWFHKLKVRIWISRKGQTIAHSLLITKVLTTLHYTTPN